MESLKFSRIKGDTPLNPRTSKGYARSLYALAYRMGVLPEKAGVCLIKYKHFKNWDDIIYAIERADVDVYPIYKHHQLITTQRKADILKALLGYLKHYVVKWQMDDDGNHQQPDLLAEMALIYTKCQSKLKDLYAVIFALVEEGKKSKREEDNWVHWDKIEECFQYNKKLFVSDGLKHKDTLNTKQFQLMQRLLISALFTRLPPVRNVYRSITFIRDKDFKKLPETNPVGNYIIHDKKFVHVEIYLGDRKSARHNGYRVKVPKIVKKIIKLSRKWNKSPYLLVKVSKRDKPLASNQMTQEIQEAFSKTGKNIGCTMLRKIYESREDVSEMIQAGIDHASAMGHTLATAQKYYIKKKE